MNPHIQGWVSRTRRPVWLLVGLGALFSILFLLRLKRKKAPREAGFQIPALGQAARGKPDGRPLAPAATRVAVPTISAPAPEARLPRLPAWLTSVNSGRLLPPVLMILGLAAAYAGQAIFNEWQADGIKIAGEAISRLTEPQLILAGCACFAAAIALWLLAWRRPARQTPAAGKPQGVGSRAMPGMTLRSLALYTGAGLSLISTLVYATRGENPFVRTAWLTGILLFLAAVLPEGSRVESRREFSPAFRWHHILILGLILTGGLWLRMISLETIPLDFHGDMASEGLIARDLLLGVERNIFHSNWSGLPEISFLPITASMKIFGNNLFGLRLSAVFAGMISLAGLYLLTWRLFDSHRLAALATALLAVNIPHIHFSRIPAYGDALPGILFGFYFLIDGLRSRRRGPLALAGAILGLAFEMYFSARLIVLLVGVLLVYLYLFHRPWIEDNRSGLGLAAAAALMVNGPFIFYFIKEPDTFISRSREVWLFTPDVMRHLMGKYNASGPLGVIWEQAKRSLLMFNYYQDSSTQFGYGFPLFLWLTAPLVPLGAALSIRRWREPSAFLAAAWVALGMIFGSILTVDAPFWPRVVVLLPLAAVLAALPLDALISKVEVPGRRLVATGFTALCAVFLAAAGVLGWMQYHPWVAAYIHPEASVGRFLYSLPPDLPACSFGYPYGISVRETAFLAWPRQVSDFVVETPVSDLGGCPASPVVWIFTGESLYRLPEVEQGWPGGTLTQHFAANGEILFTSYLTGADYAEVTWPGSNTTAGPITDPAPAVVPLFGTLVLFAAAVVFLWQHEKPVLNLRRISFLDTSLRLLALQPASRLRPLFDELKGQLAPANSLQIRPEARRVLALPALAIFLVYLAQAFFDIPRSEGIHLPGLTLVGMPENARFAAGALLTLAGMMVWAIATRSRERKELEIVPFSGFRFWKNVLKTCSSQPLVLAGVTLAVTAAGMAVYAAAGETEILRWLWPAGMALALISAWQAQQRWYPVGKAEASPSFQNVHLLALGILLLSAVSLRLYRLDSIPYEISTDMAAYGMVARDYVLGNTHELFGEGWYYIPRVEFFLAAVTMHVAGNNLYGLYLATVIFGMVNLAAVYLLVWRLSDSHQLALLTLGVLAFNPAHIEYSRISNFMTPWAPGYLGLYFFVDGLRGRKPLSLAASGILTGLALQVYPAGRILPLILLALLVYAWFFRRRWISENLPGLAVMALAGLAALGPNLVYFIRSWDVYTARAQEVVLFTPDIQRHLSFTYQTSSSWVILWEQFRRSLFTFQYFSDVSAQFAYPHPMFSSYLAPLLFLGCGTALTRLRKPVYFTILLIFLLILVTGGVLTVNAPTWARLVGLLPAAAFLIALPLDGIIRRLPVVLGQNSRRVVLTAASLLVLLAGLNEWQIYRAEVSTYGRPAVQAARFLGSLPQEYTACGVTSVFDLTWAEIQFMAWPRTLVALDPANPDLENTACARLPVVWIVTPDHIQVLDQIKARYPGGVEIYHPNYEGHVDIISYRLP